MLVVAATQHSSFAKFALSYHRCARQLCPPPMLEANFSLLGNWRSCDDHDIYMLGAQVVAFLDRSSQPSVTSTWCEEYPRAGTAEHSRGTMNVKSIVFCISYYSLYRIIVFRSIRICRGVRFVSMLAVAVGCMTVFM